MLDVIHFITERKKRKEEKKGRGTGGEHLNQTEKNTNVFCILAQL